VNFELVESAIPPVGEVEDRHVEHKHRIVHSPVAPEHFSPFVREIALRSFHSCFSLSKESPPIYFLSRVHSSCLLLSVVEPEKGEKADQNPERRAENSEPQ